MKQHVNSQESAQQGAYLGLGVHLGCVLEQERGHFTVASSGRHVERSLHFLDITQRGWGHLVQLAYIKNTRGRGHLVQLVYIKNTRAE